jgi:hypothetical protein
MESNVKRDEHQKSSNKKILLTEINRKKSGSSEGRQTYTRDIILTIRIFDQKFECSSKYQIGFMMGKIKQLHGQN